MLVCVWLVLVWFLVGFPPKYLPNNPQTPPKYGIRGIPTLMVFKAGQVEATKVGAVSKAQLTAFLDDNL